MFTGLIEQQGQVLENQQNRLLIQASFEALKTGESIAVNGVCLTLLPHHDTNSLVFDVSPETLSKTMLGRLKSGDYVNLERAMLANARFGGHYVTGHVDCTTTIAAINVLNGGKEFILGPFKPEQMKYLITKGSIAVNGVSLTINAVDDYCIALFLIPHTLRETTLKWCNLQELVNIEFDYIARLVAHQSLCK